MQLKYILPYFDGFKYYSINRNNNHYIFITNRLPEGAKNGRSFGVNFFLFPMFIRNKPEGIKIIRK